MIQKIWEDIFSELLGYGKLFGEIDVHRSIQIGSKERAVTDIIIKSGDRDLFVVELKQHSIATGTNQLFSYLKLLHNDIGILINNKLALIAYDYMQDDDNQVLVETDFEIDSNDGALFIDLFSKPFQKEKARDYILQRSKSQTAVQEIKEMINDKYLTDLVYSELLKKYNQTDVELALEGIRFGIFTNSLSHIQDENTDYLELSSYPVSNSKDVGQPIGEVVQRFFAKASLSNALPKDMLKKLCDLNYCKHVFHINLPVLKEVLNFDKIDTYRKDSKGFARYYKKPISFHGSTYILCSQWTTIQEQYFHKWMKNQR